MEQKGKTYTPRIYVTSLADYNAGKLHGRWIDADQDADGIRREIAEMLNTSEAPDAEEWAIHDFEHFPGLELGEYESIEDIAEVAALLAKYGGFFGELVQHFGGLSHLHEAQRCMEEGGYCGAFKSLEDYVYEFVEDCYGDSLNGLPDFIRGHLDYEGMARDLEISGDVFTIECDGETHVFLGNF